MLKTATIIPAATAAYSSRARFNPISQLNPEMLTLTLNRFHAGDVRQAALLWESIEQRDDLIKSVATKRKKSPARYGWEIELLEDSARARRHQRALHDFYRSIRVTSVADRNEQGGFSLLVRQMMDCIGKRYAVHEIIWEPQVSAVSGEPSLRATFQFVPLWHFENRSGRLRYLQSDTATSGIELEEGGWLISCGDGLMEASSIAYLFKHLPLRDWLVYCERNGMPGVRGVTDALPGSPEWDSAAEAVRSFGAEFHALMGSGTQIEAIDLSSNGPLPYPQLVERMDKAIATLWRGSSMGSVTDEGTGISLQLKETEILEREDVVHLSGILATQVDPWVTRHLFNEEPLARINLRYRQQGLNSEQIDDARSLLSEAFSRALKQLGGLLLPEIFSKTKPQQRSPMQPAAEAEPKERDAATSTNGKLG